MSLKYSINCSSMDERDVALFKSLIGIIGRKGTAEWVYSEAPDADVVIIDTDVRSHVAAAHASRSRAVVAYATPDKTLIPNTYALAKPARARDLMELLTDIQSRLEKTA